MDVAGVAMRRFSAIVLRACGETRITMTLGQENCPRRRVGGENEEAKRED